MDNDNTLVEALVALKPFLSKVEDNSITISTIDNRLALVMEEVKKLSRILYEGNGQPPLTTRIAALEASLSLVRDALREEKEVISKLLVQIQAVDKTSIEVGIALEEYQVNEKGKRDAAEAKNLVNYEWRLNIIQGITLLLLTTVTGYIGTGIYSAIRGGIDITPPTQKVK